MNNFLLGTDGHQAFCENDVYHIEDAIRQISFEQPLVEFDLGLNLEQEILLENLHIEKYKTLSLPYSGEVTTLQKSVNSYLESLSEDNLDIAQSLSDIIRIIYNNTTMRPIGQKMRKPL